MTEPVMEVWTTAGDDDGVGHGQRWWVCSHVVTVIDALIGGGMREPGWHDRTGNRRW